MLLHNPHIKRRTSETKNETNKVPNDIIAQYRSAGLTSVHRIITVPLILSLEGINSTNVFDTHSFR